MPYTRQRRTKNLRSPLFLHVLVVGLGEIHRIRPLKNLCKRDVIATHEIYFMIGKNSEIYGKSKIE